MLSLTDTVQANNSNTSILQPMGFSEILDTTFSLYRKHFRLFLGIISLHFCGHLVVYLLWLFLPNVPVRNLVTEFVDIPFGLISMGGIIAATSTIYLGKHITSRDALQQTGHRFWQMLGSLLPWSLVFVIPRAVSIFPIFYYAGYADVWEPGADIRESTESSILMLEWTIFIRLVSAPFAIDLPMNWESITQSLIPWVTRHGYIWIGLIPLVFAPFSIYFAVRWLFAPAAVLIEKPFIRPAFERSSALTRGSWWRVWGLLTSFGVLSSTIQYIIAVMTGFILTLTTGTDETTLIDILKRIVILRFDSINPLFSLIMWWFNVIVATFIYPIWVIGITLLYFDLRIRKEGFDIEIQANTTAMPT
ncbi:hypothetical protein F4054_01110 [Candidatus Poribacteria bacterium]|nr:hypothetical protein [Candidatus Poribacteria bacterium]MYG08318.1 hypothetical protein [Candidatus Poribacteria bacterium]MYK20840.1 hypothetical protein [Candidatus Poribacteria bacterium]